MVNARAAAMTLSILPMDAVCICPLWRSHSLADLFEEISLAARRFDSDQRFNADHAQPMSAFGGKADIGLTPEMSAFDLKRMSLNPVIRLASVAPTDSLYRL